MNPVIFTLATVILAAFYGLILLSGWIALRKKKCMFSSFRNFMTILTAMIFIPWNAAFQDTTNCVTISSAFSTAYSSLGTIGEQHPFDQAVFLTEILITAYVVYLLREISKNTRKS